MGLATVKVPRIDTMKAIVIARIQTPSTNKKTAFQIGTNRATEFDMKPRCC